MFHLSKMMARLHVPDALAILERMDPCGTQFYESTIFKCGD